LFARSYATRHEGEGMKFLLVVWILVHSSGKDLFLEKQFPTMEQCQARLTEITQTPIIDGSIVTIECLKVKE
jgi:Tfp pilus assembly ATPase PilU